MRISTALLFLRVTAPREVQFNCPWCSTRLALPEQDFARERAVLCPRCNNPVDLTVQRRTMAAVPPVPVAQPPRRQVTVPQSDIIQETQDKAEMANAVQAGAANPQPAPAPQPKKRGSGALDFDPNKPIDIDHAFQGEPIQVDDIDSLMSRSDLWSMAGPRRSVTGGAGASKPGEVSGMVICPACKYENSPVPTGFEFGKVRKCTWCGKPLPP